MTGYPRFVVAAFAQSARVATLASSFLGAALASPCVAQDLPSGGQTDCAMLLYGEDALHVLQFTPNCVINWDTFDIGIGHLVDFNQLRSWRVLNRVTGDQFSRIAGTLRADGTVYIVNPAGIYFTGSAVVDVGGIYAAAAAITDEDFLAGVDQFTGLSGEVVNEGSLLGQVVHLIGRRVLNSGSITASGGTVTLLAGEQEVLIRETGGRILVRIDGVDLPPDLSVADGGVPPTSNGRAGVENTGSVNADHGQVILGAGDLYSLAIRNTGEISARGGSAQLTALGGTVVHGGTSGAIAAGDLSMTGDALLLDGNINADNARFNDPVIIGSDLLIEGETAGTDASSVLFASTVDSETNEQNTLDVNSANTILQDDVGAQSRLDNLDISGVAEVAGDVLTTNGLTFGDDATFTAIGNQTVNAGAGTLSAHGTLTKTTGGSLALRSAATVDLDDDVAVNNAGGNLTVTAPLVVAAGNLTAAGGRVTVNGASNIAGSVSGGSDVQFSGDAEVGGDVTAGDDAMFFGSADVSGNVTAGDDVQFLRSAAVDGDVTAVDDVSFFAAADVGGSVTAGDDLSFFGDAVVGGNVNAGDDALFLSSAEIGGAVTAGDDLVFSGTVIADGAVTAGDDAIFRGDATVGGDVTAGDDAVFMGPTSLNANVTAGDDARFFGNADVGGSVMAGGDAEFAGETNVSGDVRAGDDAEFFAGAIVGGNVTAGDDASFFGHADVGGNVTATGDAEFFSNARVDGDVTAGDDVEFAQAATLGGNVRAADAVRMDGTVTFKGAGDQRVEAEQGALRAKGSLIKTTAGNLTLVGGGHLILNGSLVRAIGDIRLNPEGPDGVPTAATMSANRDLSIISVAGSVIMGRREKLTVLGDLTIDAANRATLGDVNTLGDMIVMAQEILLRTRRPGSVLTFLGGSEIDSGADLVAGGRFFFGVAPQVLGDGPRPRFASAVVEADALGTLGDFRVRVIEPFSSEMLKLNGTILDLRADGPTATELAEALAADPQDPDRRSVPVNAALAPGEGDELGRLGIKVRPLNPAELRDGLSGRYLYNDAASLAPRPDNEREIAVNRLRRASMTQILRRSQELFAREVVDKDAGDIVRTDPSFSVRETLETAWHAYSRSTGAPEGVGFRQYLESRPELAEALGYINGLREMLAEIRISGLSPRELFISRRVILNTLTPSAIPPPQFEATIEGG
ncbi:MAG: two-partner secretion domain-containing protein [Planctomycetota bacterium]|jgi:filamentous hemagglutinin family protein